ncbi:hypothetical protein ACFX5K_01360 [Rickettsiales bacterium LUAb2]
MAGQFNSDIWKQYMSPAMNLSNNLIASGVMDGPNINTNSLNVDRDSQIAKANMVNAAMKNPENLKAIARANSGEAAPSTTSKVGTVLQNLGNALTNAGNTGGGQMVSGYYVPKSNMSANTLSAIGNALGNSFDQFNQQDAQVNQDKALASLYQDLGVGEVAGSNKDFDNKKDLLNTQITGQGNNQLNAIDAQNTGRLENTYLDNSMKGSNSLQLANINAKEKANQPLSPLQQEQLKALQMKNDAAADSEKIRQNKIEDNKKVAFHMIDLLNGIDDNYFGPGLLKEGARHLNSVRGSDLQSKVQDYQNSLDQHLAERMAFMTGNKTEKEMDVIKETGFNPNATKEQNFQALKSILLNLGIKPDDIQSYWDKLQPKQNQEQQINNNENSNNPSVFNKNLW